MTNKEILDTIGRGNVEVVSMRAVGGYQDAPAVEVVVKNYSGRESRHYIGTDTVEQAKNFVRDWR